MPYTLSVNPTTRIASIVVDHASSLEEVLEAVSCLIADIRFGDRLGVLIDLREMRYTPFADEASKLASDIAGIKPLRGGPVGIIATHGAHRSLANMIAEFVCLHRGVARAFHGSRETAVIWLENQIDAKRGTAQ